MSPRARFILRALGLLVLLIVAAWVLYYQFRGKYLEAPTTPSSRPTA
jgi:membrane fusion protein (multidrug efflux system)